MWLKSISIVAAVSLAIVATPAFSEDTNVYDQFQCPNDGGGGSGGGEICICGCGSFANGNFWDCSPNGCDSKDGKTCTPSKKPANSRKSTVKEMTIIAKLFPRAPKKSMQTCVMTKK